MMLHRLMLLLTAHCAVLVASAAQADRLMLGGDPAHTGASADAAPAGPCGLIWARHFKNERLSSALEPIVAKGKGFVTTHKGSLYAIHAETGNPAWRAAFPGPILQAPAIAGDSVIAADVTGRVAILDTERGTLRHELTLDPAGFAAAPVVAGDVAILSSRGGEVYAVNVTTGIVKW